MNDPYDSLVNQELYSAWDYEAYLERREQSAICRNGVHCDQTFCPDHRLFDTWNPREWPALEQVEL